MASGGMFRWPMLDQYHLYELGPYFAYGFGFTEVPSVGPKELCGLYALARSIRAVHTFEPNMLPGDLRNPLDWYISTLQIIFGEREIWEREVDSWINSLGPVSARPGPDGSSPEPYVYGSMSDKDRNDLRERLMTTKWLIQDHLHILLRLWCRRMGLNYRLGVVHNDIQRNLHFTKIAMSEHKGPVVWLQAFDFTHWHPLEQDEYENPINQKLQADSLINSALVLRTSLVLEDHHPDRFNKHHTFPRGVFVVEMASNSKAPLIPPEMIRVGLMVNSREEQGYIPRVKLKRVIRLGGRRGDRGGSNRVPPPPVPPPKAEPSKADPPQQEPPKEEPPKEKKPKQDPPGRRPRKIGPPKQKPSKQGAPKQEPPGSGPPPAPPEPPKPSGEPGEPEPPGEPGEPGEPEWPPGGPPGPGNGGKEEDEVKKEQEEVKIEQEDVKIEQEAVKIEQEDIKMEEEVENGGPGAQPEQQLEDLIMYYTLTARTQKRRNHRGREVTLTNAPRRKLTYGKRQLMLHVLPAAPDDPRERILIRDVHGREGLIASNHLSDPIINPWGIGKRIKDGPVDGRRRSYIGRPHVRYHRLQNEYARRNLAGWGTNDQLRSRLIIDDIDTLARRAAGARLNISYARIEPEGPLPLQASYFLGTGDIYPVPTLGPRSEQPHHDGHYVRILSSNVEDDTSVVMNLRGRKARFDAGQLKNVYDPWRIRVAAPPSPQVSPGFEFQGIGFQGEGGEDGDSEDYDDIRGQEAGPHVDRWLRRWQP